MPTTLVHVKAGDLIVYHTRVPGLDDAKKDAGAWFLLANKDAACTYDTPVIAQALLPFSYEDKIGARYHAVKFRVVRRYYSDERAGVGRGSQVVTPETLRDEHAVHLGAAVVPDDPAKVAELAAINAAEGR